MTFTFADLFAGIGGFHAVLSHAGGRCVYVSEIDPEAAAIYRANWVDELDPPIINTNIALATPNSGDLIDVPDQIDVLAAGFPCQPFSKSGRQAGMDEARGSLFWNIARIVEERRPSVLLLENVRNLVGPRHMHEWKVIIQTLHGLDYKVSSTPSVFSPHFLPPELGGTPQVRDRVFILATYAGAGQAPDPQTVPPTLVRGPVDGWDPMNWDIEWTLDEDCEIAQLERYRLTDTETEWLDLWDGLIQKLPEHKPGQRLPGFPLWADHWVPESSLNRKKLDRLPGWKSTFLRKNARYYDENRAVIDRWLGDPRFFRLPPSRRKLEWQAQDADSLWDTVTQFRPSGIRCKKPTYLPALVAMNQTSIIGSRGRKITPDEAIRLQGMPRSFSFGSQRDAANYKQAGNGVCVGAAWWALRQHVLRDRDLIPERIARAILEAPQNPSPDSLTVAGVEPALIA